MRVHVNPEAFRQATRTWKTWSYQRYLMIDFPPILLQEGDEILEFQEHILLNDLDVCPRPSQLIDLLQQELSHFENGFHAEFLHHRLDILQKKAMQQIPEHVLSPVQRQTTGQESGSIN